MAKISIKIDWMNFRVEFSPNINIIDVKSDKDKSTIHLETKDIYSDKEYTVYILSEDKLEKEEPFDEEDRFWKGFIEQSGQNQIKTSTDQTSPIISPPSTSLNREKGIEDPKLIERRKIESQMETIQKMISKIDSDFQKGLINQVEYIKRKEFLAEKMGILMGKLEQL